METLEEILNQRREEVRDLEELIILTGLSLTEICANYDSSCMSRKAWIRACRHSYLNIGRLPNNCSEALAIWMMY